MDDTLSKFTRKNRENKKPKPKVTTPETTPDSEPVGIIHVIARGSNDGKGKNKCVAENILLVEQEPWAKQEVMFGLADKTIGFFQNDPLVIRIRLNK